MANRDSILRFLEQQLDVAGFEDHSLNGLQIEGASEINRIAVAVDSGLSIIREALRRDAQMLIVHHGLFWGKSIPLVGPNRVLVAEAFAAGLNLVALHLPLDAHLVLGNNAALAETLELTEIIPAAHFGSRCVGVIGKNSRSRSVAEISNRLSGLTGCRTPFVELRFGPQIPDRLCIVSGSGADQLLQHAAEGFDTLITGEPRQFAYHYCKEHKLNALFPGHYATETLGVQRIGAALAQQFGVSWEFIDEPTGI